MRDIKFLVGVAMMFCLGIIMLFLYNQSIAYEEEETHKKHIDALLMTLENKIEEITKVSLASSVILAQNPYVVECLEQKKRQECVEKLLDVKNAIMATSLFDNIKFHLHTNDYKSFVRLWDYENATEDDLSAFRGAFDKLKKGKKPLKGIEIGRHGMFIRAIAPVMRGYEYVGSIETAVGFESLNEYFKKEGIDFYVLMNNNQKNIANAIAYPPSLALDNYAIINRPTNGLNLVKSINFQGTGYLKSGDHTILYTPIIDMNGLHVGFFVLTWTQSMSLGSFK